MCLCFPLKLSSLCGWGVCTCVFCQGQAFQQNKHKVDFGQLFLLKTIQYTSIRTLYNLEKQISISVAAVQTVFNKTHHFVHKIWTEQSFLEY